MDLENTSPGTLNNKIIILFLSIVFGVPLMLIGMALLEPYLGLLSVIVVIVPYAFYARWASNKISDYNWRLDIIDDMKRRIWQRH